MATVTKAQIKLKDGQSIQHVTGVYSKEISIKDLKKHPEKYANIYPTFYKNTKALLHEVNTRLKKVNAIGDKNILKQQKASNGVVYSILRGKNGKSSSN